MIAKKMLFCKILAIKGKIALISLSGKEIEIEREYLPLGTKGGDELAIALQTKEKAELDHQKLAKVILEEILNGK
jgi:hypothetical protein